MAGILLFIRPCVSSTLILGFTVLLTTVVLLGSCTGIDPVKEYFQVHGRSYPVEVTGLSVWSLKYSGVKEEELVSPEARDYVEEGLQATREYFKRKEFGKFDLYVDAIIVSTPVLFRDGSEDVGLMVKVVAYGSGEPDSNMSLPIEWVGKDDKLWKVENFAYFNRRGIDMWQHSGWVY